jgi:hypothetical protein
MLHSTNAFSLFSNLQAAASKREEALQKRIQLLESELDSIRSSSVSELQHHKILDEMKARIDHIHPGS